MYLHTPSCEPRGSGSGRGDPRPEELSLEAFRGLAVAGTRPQLGGHHGTQEQPGRRGFAEPVECRAERWAARAQGRDHESRECPWAPRVGPGGLELSGSAAAGERRAQSRPAGSAGDILAGRDAVRRRPAESVRLEGGSARRSHFVSLRRGDTRTGEYQQDHPRSGLGPRPHILECGRQARPEQTIMNNEPRTRLTPAQSYQRPCHQPKRGS